MSDKFKALIINQEGENFHREIKTIDKSFLKHGDVLVKVDYSGLNYKDALILKNGARLVKEFPHIPGIDFSGKVIESQNNKFKEGNKTTDDLKCFCLFSVTLVTPLGILSNVGVCKRSCKCSTNPVLTSLGIIKSTSDNFFNSEE